MEGTSGQARRPSLLVFFPTEIFKVFYFQGSEKVRDIPLPEELAFTVDEKILNDVYQAKAQHLKAVGFSVSFKLVMCSFY